MNRVYEFRKNFNYSLLSCTKLLFSQECTIHSAYPSEEVMNQKSEKVWDGKAVRMQQEFWSKKVQGYIKLTHETGHKLGMEYSFYRSSYALRSICHGCVCLSVTSWSSTKMTKHRKMQTTLWFIVITIHVSGYRYFLTLMFRKVV